MSVLRRALGRPHAERPLLNATGITYTSTATRTPQPPEGYGIPGYGGWDAGMIWRSVVNRSTVTNEQASRLSAVYACWRLITDAICTLPLDTYVPDGPSEKLYRPRPKYLNFDPPQASRINYVAQLVLSLLADGNAFVATPRDALGVPIDLIPLDPTSVTVRRVGGELSYQVRSQSYTHLDIMHIQGLTTPGALRGMSPIQAAREMLTGALAAQEYGINFISNMSVPPAIIKVPSSGGEPQAEREKAKKIANMWHETNGGDNAGKVGVLLGGAELQTIAVNPEDAQWLDSKRFSVQEIASIYGVPPHLIGDASRSTSWGSGLAEQNQTFGSFTLQPTSERIEDAHDRLLTTHGLVGVSVKMNLDSKLRSAPLERAQTQDVRIKNGSLTINEARADEGLPPVPWGDTWSPPAPAAPGPKPAAPGTPPAPGAPPAPAAPNGRNGIAALSINGVSGTWNRLETTA